MIIKNGKVAYIVPIKGANHGRDANGDAVTDVEKRTRETDCNIEVSSRTYSGGGEHETFTQAVYRVIVAERPPAGAEYVELTQVDGLDLGRSTIDNIEPLIAVKAYRITAHANKR